MRNAFSEGLVAQAKEDRRVMLLTGDHGYALFNDFRRFCPDQYVNAGIAEQNMIGVCAGIAKAGLRPVAYGLAAFLPIRVLEQIKLDICYTPLPVMLIGDGAGLVYSHLGSSHQSTEDVAALRALPHMTILSPSDPFEMRACLRHAFTLSGPVYVRIGKSDVGHVHTTTPTLESGRLISLRNGTGPVAFIATGSMVVRALEVAERFPGTAVWSAPFIKPLDVDQIAEICRHYPHVAVLEEHSVLGGLGSAIAEIAGERAPTQVHRFGVDDRFSDRCGTWAYLMRGFGLDTDGLVARTERVLRGDATR